MRFPETLLPRAKARALGRHRAAEHRSETEHRPSTVGQSGAAKESGGSMMYLNYCRVLYIYSIRIYPNPIPLGGAMEGTQKLQLKTHLDNQS